MAENRARLWRWAMLRRMLCPSIRLLTLAHASERRLRVLAKWGTWGDTAQPLCLAAPMGAHEVETQLPGAKGPRQDLRGALGVAQGHGAEGSGSPARAAGQAALPSPLR